MNTNALFIGCDSAAVEFKDAIVSFLREKGYEVKDLGVRAPEDDTAYALVAERVALEVLAAPGSRGILFCGTGIGVAMAANKVPGIRAAQVHDSYSAERAALSNDANVVTMGARVIGLELGKKLLLEWLSHRFRAGPSSRKIDAITEVERRYGHGASNIP